MVITQTSRDEDLGKFLRIGIYHLQLQLVSTAFDGADIRKVFEALDTFKLFQKHVELQLGHKILAVQSDWGGEYRPFTGFLHSQGIVHRNSCPHSHQQNGLAERFNKTILDRVMCMLLSRPASDSSPTNRD
ncbi:MAG: transposase [Pedobacter sp.]|nr:MAG: transposase [Pedobacter sp.]